MWLEAGPINYIVKRVFNFALKLPGARGQISGMVEKEKDAFIGKILKKRGEPISKLPERGIREEQIMQRINREGVVSDKLVNKGQMSGAVYTKEKEHWDFICEVVRKHVFANPIHLDDFTFACQAESEVIRMTIDLYNGTKDCVGLVTSGGTESIFSATLAYREHGKNERGITQGNVIVCETAHCAIQKSCHYLGLEIRKIKRDPKTKLFNLRAAEKAIDSNTLFIYASSPEYAFGNYDPVPAIGALCQRYGIGLHNDCCLGSFVNPFIEKSGY